MSESILSLEQAAVKRWCGGDSPAWAQISAADLIYIDPNLSKPILGLAEFKAYLKGPVQRICPIDPELIEPQVTRVGDAAVLTYSLLEAEGGRPLWNVTQVYFRRQGEWKIVHGHWGYIQQRLPERLEVPIPIQVAPAPFEGVLGELMTLEAAAMQRWRTGDPFGYVEISTPEVTYLDVGTQPRLTGCEALRAYYAQAAGKIFFEVMDFVDPQVRVCGDLAVMPFRFISTSLNPDGSVARCTPWNVSEVYVRRDGQWRILHTHFSFNQGQRAA
ncbi:ketosteroid isomerase homolog [Longilinea arvoryzae]|uniref:Ketosteroid isomerase homolog n=1 Tax=Longilinea arvoryzae TaxID=360412 RepID=A0A0S7B6L9_9CHLR|nr:nuclear transport factor 2 family protein [Longilinea arvoryzae]GAP12679.1 ketosteroid isomerase homolog [Longilinea arvoryzae]